MVEQVKRTSDSDVVLLHGRNWEVAVDDHWEIPQPMAFQSS